MKRLPPIPLLLVLACVLPTWVRGDGDPPPRSEAETLATGFRRAARRIEPSVVSVRRWEPGPPDGPDPVAVPRPRGGSGLVVDAEHGWVLTNHHVVAGSDRVVVTLPGGGERISTAIRSDPASDLALVEIAPGTLVAAAWGDPDRLGVGDWVLASGHPFGLEGTLTAGIVGGRGRGAGLTPYEDLIQTDAAINPGNSGGPLVNLDGEVVGIVTALKTSGGGFEGVGFAVPATRARWVAAELATAGRVRRSVVGIKVRRAAPEVRERTGIAGASVVTEVEPRGPAAAAGLRPGDLVLRVGDQPLAGPGPLQARIEAAEAGRPLSITVERGGASLVVTLTPRPTTMDSPPWAAGSTRGRPEVSP